MENFEVDVITYKLDGDNVGYELRTLTIRAESPEIAKAIVYEQLGYSLADGTTIVPGEVREITIN